MLLEGLIAVLIFSMGILAIVGMQAAAVKASTDAKYRSDAAMLANDLIGTMWVSNRRPATLIANFDSRQGGTGYTNWLAKVKAVYPLVDAGTAPSPVVAVSNSANGVNQVCIAIFWQSPNETSTSTATVCGNISVAGVAHYYTVSAQIK